MGIADLIATDRPHETITTFALGSCLGVTCYDSVNRVGGLLHAMLPDSTQRSRDELNPAMYLDTGIRSLLHSVIELGGDPKHSEFKVFGGACVNASSDFFNIGKRNVEAMAAISHELDLKVVYWHVGGGANRTITLFLDNGEILVRMPNRREITL